MIMSATTVSLDGLHVIPNVKEINALEGVTELSEDVRLVTSNVLPLQRKAMRGIFARAGIRVVANKKKFVIEIKVVKPEKLALSGVAAEVHEDYYEVEMRDNVVTIRSASQSGALWGCFTFAWMFMAAGKDSHVPNLLIRDWSVVPVRGMMVEAGRGGVLMEQDAWFELMSRMASVKLNHLAIRLWGHNQGRGNADERLLISLVDDPEMHSQSSCKWFSPRDDQWCAETMVPKLAETEKLADLVVYAKERDIVLAPYVDGLGRGAPFARIKSELSALGSDGKPTGLSLCPSNPAVREFLKSLCASVFERYYPTGVQAFHLDFSNLGDEPLCHCDLCKASSNEDLVKGLSEWFSDMLAKQGVSQCYVWQGDQACVSGAGAVAAKASRQTLDQAARKGVGSGEKAVFASVEDYDPGWSNRLSEFALSAWTGCEDVAGVKLEDGVWAGLVLGSSCEQPYRQAAAKLAAASLAFADASGVCLEPCCEGEVACTLHPERLVASIDAGGENVAKFAAAAQSASDASDLLKPLAEDKEICRDVDFVKSLLADAETIAGLAGYFQALCNGGGQEQARAGILRALAAIQDNKPRWVVPFQLSELSAFVECLG